MAILAERRSNRGGDSINIPGIAIYLPWWWFWLFDFLLRDWACVSGCVVDDSRITCF